MDKKFISSKTDNERNRNKWIEQQLKSLPAGERILDAGAGELKWREACTHLNYISQDFGKYEGRGDGKALQTGSWNTSEVDIISDIIDIPVEDGFFDAILCSEVLEHLPNPELAIKEFSRIIKPNGTLILTAPFCSLTHFAPYHFCTGFNIYWYEKHLENYGFKIIEAIRNGDYFSYIFQELKRLPWMKKQYIKEKATWGVLDKLNMYFLTRRLKKFSDIDNTSDEVLCFGYQIKAVKSNRTF